MPRVLGIETSCDETAAAVVEDGRRILSNVVASQIPLHRRFGGVVPEVASRRHVEAILPVITEAMEVAGVGFDAIDGIAVTRGPGLVGSLLVGIAAAKALALAYGLPLIGVNHIEGHIYANFLQHPEVKPPLVCLTVSGGHTELFYVPETGVYEVMGRTLDDAAGEALDKVGRLLGLNYPAGPDLERLAEGGDPQAFHLPRALLGEAGYDFSFSGVKTAAMLALRALEQEGKDIPKADFAASLQAAVFDVLVERAVRAARERGVQTLLLSGGVAANRRLRRMMQEAAEPLGIDVFAPDVSLCTDNAAMIASAGYYRLERGETSPWSFTAAPGLRLQ